MHSYVAWQAAGPERPGGCARRCLRRCHSGSPTGAPTPRCSATRTSSAGCCRPSPSTPATSRRRSEGWTGYRRTAPRCWSGTIRACSTCPRHGPAGRPSWNAAASTHRHTCSATICCSPSPASARSCAASAPIPASTSQAEAALARGACVLVYPGGDREACRPWTQRNEVDFDGRTGFVRLALQCGVPVIPVAAHGGHHAVVVLARGERLARVAGLGTLRINVFPLLAGPPFGVTSILAPPPPLPAHLTVEFLPALDWTGYGPGAADDMRIVSACYEDITGRLQAALDRLSTEYPHPVLLGCSRITAHTAARAIQRARSRRHRPRSGRLPDPVFQAPHRLPSYQRP